MSGEYQSAWIDHIPVIWLEPTKPGPARRLAIFLSGLTGTKESNLPYLKDLAEAGFVALSFDCWEHGERTGMSAEEIGQRTFGNFRRYMWANIGQSALDTLRVIDWAVDRLGVTEDVVMAGISMGGDIAVAAAGLDRRIGRAGAFVATPDWQRPGMVALFAEEKAPMDQGRPDAYARWLFEQINPMTHLGHYAHGPQILFLNAAEDDHVPPEAAFRFKAGLGALYPRAGENVTIELLAGHNHLTAGRERETWWPRMRDWLVG